MKELLHYLTSQLVEHPLAVKVEQQGEENNQRLLLSVDKSDLGKIIGKKGRTIKAIRTFLNAAGKERNIRAEVFITNSTQAEENPS